MALVQCKQDKCDNWVATDATTCPGCGTKDPTISYQEEQLMWGIENAKKDVDKYWKITVGDYNPGWFVQLIVLIFGHSTGFQQQLDLLDEAKERGWRLENELAELRAKKVYK